MKKLIMTAALMASSAFAADCGWGEVQVCTWVDAYPGFYGFWACECQNNVWPIANVEKKNTSTYSVFLPTNLTPEETEKALQSVQSKFVKKAEKKESEKKLETQISK